MNADKLKAMYTEYVHQKLRSICRLSGAVGPLVLIACMYMDVVLLKLNPVVSTANRSIPLVIALFTLALSFTKFKVKTAHNFFLFSISTMQCVLIYITLNLPVFNDYLVGMMCSTFVVFLLYRGNLITLAGIYFVPFITLLVWILSDGFQLRYVPNFINPVITMIVCLILHQANEKLKYKEYTGTIELSEAKEALASEMEIAQHIQTVLLPENPVIQGFKVSTYMQPTHDVGGDYYDIITMEDKNWFFIGDVSGHGVNAGLVMMIVQSSIHTLLTAYNNVLPSMIIKSINNAVTEDIKKIDESRYMTITALSIDNQGVVTHAGLHQDILVYRAEHDMIEVIETTGMWIGMLEFVDEYIVDSVFQLHKHDILLLYTDGITEAVNKHTGNLYGDSHLADVFLSSISHDLCSIKQSILLSLSNYIIRDDVSFMLVKKL